MQLPAYWWLLALVVFVQGAFFVRIVILRMWRKGVQPLARSVAGMLVASCMAGFVYGIVQRDPLFCLGQLCLLAIYHLLQRQGDDQRK
ncbi:hypothetical protein SYK_10290 [Pseudodesulfovibrio nedwellii]|uniref:Lipid A biosynthesis N-terminal domain-containing protein n=1 Tax=Pseudodesulfovibrio nedwellii TaxID=2973072 RepID=A0ABN6S0E1_9BACT|nr:hypothetical protein SYK_10290 [Pseudodesulfovibrio nedwellii]